LWGGRLREPLEQSGQLAGCVVGAPANSFDRATHGFLESRLEHRLEHIVDGLNLERLDGVLVVSRDEDDQRRIVFGDLANDLRSRPFPAFGCRGTRDRGAPRGSSFTASVPEPASPAISTSDSFARSARNRFRAGGSSSTIRTRTRGRLSWHAPPCDTESRS
jgi:hypothetical protein